MKKNKISKGTLLIIICDLLAVMFLWIFSIFWTESVIVYGDRSLEGAKVYIDNQYAGTMVWDEENKRTYAREERLFYLPSKLLSQTDNVFLWIGLSKVEFKIITKDKIYKDTFTNGEDVAYLVYFNVNKFKVYEGN